MAYQLTERPHKYSFSNNPIRYVFHISNPDTPGCALEVELYTIPINEVLPAGELGILITRQTLYPNPDGTVNFYCEDFLNSYLEWQLPSLRTNEVVAVTKQIRKYYVRYRQVSKSNPSPLWATDADNMRTVLKGGIAKEKFDRNNFFINYLTQKKPFLTWQPAGHFIGLEERRYLTYFHDEDSTPDLLLKARVVYTDGSEDIAWMDFPSLSESLLFHLPAGMQQLGLYLQPDKQVWYYDVSVEDATGGVYAAPYRLYADYRQYYNVFSFMYTNSLGGIDTLRIRGDYDIELNLSVTEIQQAIDGYSGEQLPTENAVINISKYETYKGDAGWLNTQGMQDSLQDLLLSDSVYRVVNGAGNRWLRVLNLQKTQPLRSSDDTKWSFPLQWRYTFDNSQYTPDYLDFGAGVNNELPGEIYGTCTAAGNLQVTLLGDDNGGKKFRFTWDEVAGAEAYEFYFKKPGADWEGLAYPITDNFREITFFELGDFSWRVRTKCGAGDYSGYANGPGFSTNVSGSCAAPASLSVILVNIDATSATIKFTWPNVTPLGALLEWREYGASVWNSAMTGPFVTSYTTTLKRDVQYEVRIRTRCIDGNYSPYKYGSNFIPSNLIGSCSPPNSPEVTTGGILFFVLRQVTFKWSNSNGGSNYEIQYREKNTGDWAVIGNATSPYVAFIVPEKTYEWRVRTNCAGGGFSNFIKGPDFNT